MLLKLGPGKLAKARGVIMKIRTSVFPWASCASILFVLSTVPAFAQFETADVLGTVRDASTSAVSKASVTLLNQDTGALAKTTTDEGANYTFPNVKVGKYTVTGEAPGFSKAV